MPNHRYINFLAKLAVDNAHPGGHGLTEAIIERLKIREKSSILDVGCGTGATTVFLAEKLKADVTGIDLHPGMIKRAKARAALSFSAPKIIQASAEKLPFESACFDCLFSESVTAFTNVSLSVPEYFRVLKLGGLLAAIEMTIEKELDADDKGLIESVYGVSDVRTEPEWLSIWKNAGFVDMNSFHADEMKTRSEDVLPTYNLTSIIDEEAIDVWLEHMQMMQKFKDVLTYRIFTMSRPCE
ncbi:methyltransferase domain-containing protein [Sporolactobacillus shoreicorticis]|uniref:Class I SAM-dependent methyltransferase n=1 Tax=Sporolactobacillus shoreicorticis TaxID=1923877 RepID=A0ABW5S767_9BACL|nr:class I SAM-dependent methyltransferase [Sporolactobacillus shoreicorticis]MCO7126830.1 methyltransferase domain-containing protein [Sporolactobacillus shoreicorticis]